MPPCQAEHLNEPKHQPQEHQLGCVHHVDCCQAPFCSSLAEEGVWESTAWFGRAPQAEQANGKAPRAAVMKVCMWNPASIRSAPWDLSCLKHPIGSCVRKLLASTSQHRNTHKCEPPEKGSFPLCITQKVWLVKKVERCSCAGWLFSFTKRQVPCTDTSLFKGLDGRIHTSESPLP